MITTIVLIWLAIKLIKGIINFFKNSSIEKHEVQGY